MRLIQLIIAISVLTSCSNKHPNYLQLEGNAQGTTFNIQYLHPEQQALSKEVDSILLDIDMSMSEWKPNSLISKFNKSSTLSTPIDEHFTAVLNISYDIFRKTNGAFNPALKPLVAYWGFGPDQKSPNQVDSNAIDSLLQLVQFERLQIHNTSDTLFINYLRPSFFENRPVVLVKPDSSFQMDFNAVAQGYSVDVIADYLVLNGVENYFIELGGEVIAHGVNPNGKTWKVGIDKPEENLEDRSNQAAVALNNRAVATSGNYRSYLENDGAKYGHTINPTTGFPEVNDILSATVFANTAGEADAWATAFMVLGFDLSKMLVESYPEIDAYIIYTSKGVTEVYSTLPETAVTD